MIRFLALLAVIVLLVGCSGGVSGPCNYADPVGACATSQGQPAGL